jgi:hypothetical protein
MSHGENSRLIGLTCAIGLACLLAARPGAAQTCHYELDVTVEPERQRLEVEARVHVPASLVERGRLSFVLNPAFEVEGATVDGAEASIRKARRLRELPFRGALAEYSVRVKAGAEPVVVGLRYGGPLAGANEGFGGIDEHLVELALYRTWFPHWPGSPNLTHDLTVRLPDGWQVASNGYPVGSSTQEGGRPVHRFTASGPPVIDINVVASDRWQRARLEQDGWEVDALFTELEPAQGAVVARVAADALALFTREWGAAAEPGRITVAAVPRAGQSYSRLPLMVLNEEMLGRELTEDPGGCGATGIAHEIGHIWWNRGDPLTAEDWLNEALAEFARLRFVEDRCGTERLRTEQRDSVRAALGFDGQVIAGTVRTERDAYGLYYHRGSRLFGMLEDRIGRSAVQRALVTFLVEHAPRTATTDDLVAAFEQGADFDLDPFLDHWYRQPDGPLALVESIEQSASVAIVQIGLQPADRTPVTVEVEVVTDRGVVRERVQLTEARSRHRIPIVGQVLDVGINEDGRAVVWTWEMKRFDLHWDLAGSLGIVGVMEDPSSATPEQLEEAREVIDRLYKRRKGDDIARFWEARWLFLQGRNDEAAMLLEALLEQDLVDFGSSTTERGRAKARGWVRLELGRIYDLFGRRDEAVALYRLVESADLPGVSAVASVLAGRPYEWPDSLSPKE